MAGRDSGLHAFNKKRASDTRQPRLPGGPFRSPSSPPEGGRVEGSEFGDNLLLRRWRARGPCSRLRNNRALQSEA